MDEPTSSTLPRDTSLQAARVMHLLHSRLSDEERLERLFEFQDSGRELAAAGVRHRHPDYDERQVEFAVAKLAIGRELFVRAFGFDIDT